MAKKIKFKNVTEKPIGFPIVNEAGIMASFIYIDPDETLEVDEGQFSQRSIDYLLEDDQLEIVKTTSRKKTKDVAND